MDRCDRAPDARVDNQSSDSPWHPSPGADDTVVLPATGQTARVRLVRAYAAASGRECREVLVGTGGGGTSRLLCRAGEGWREARPLITAGTGRP